MGSITKEPMHKIVYKEYEIFNQKRKEEEEKIKANLEDEKI